jgi:hypothetical protein
MVLLRGKKPRNSWTCSTTSCRLYSIADSYWSFIFDGYSGRWEGEAADRLAFFAETPSGVVLMQTTLVPKI